MWRGTIAPHRRESSRRTHPTRQARKRIVPGEEHCKSNGKLSEVVNKVVNGANGGGPQEAGAVALLATLFATERKGRSHHG